MGTTTTSARSTLTKPWRRLGVILVVVAVAFTAAVLVTRWLVGTEPVSAFLTRYDGTAPTPASAPAGLPAWLGWQHFFNLFLMVLIIRTGWQIRTVRKPEAYWTRDNGKLIRTKGASTKLRFDEWMHLTFDALWMVNGAVFVVLLVVTGQWMRVVPTSWEIFPHALSVGLQYLSLDFPTENGWVHYNAMQTLAYFVTIFVAAPIAAITGFRMSPAWSKRWTRASRVFPIELARALHFPTMIYFVLFIVAHVTLVLTTGALRNLNHIYAARDEVSWVGFFLFLGSLLVIAGGWVLARVVFLQPVAQLTGKVTAR
jgi:thiosulfate reductase cytochrome b subunit